MESAYTVDEILEAARLANYAYGQFMPQGWIDQLLAGLRGELEHIATEHPPR